jgi:non-heme chloroperoxidase
MTKLVTANGTELAYVGGVNEPNATGLLITASGAEILKDALAHVADATTSRPRPIFTCEMAQRITVPTLLSNGARSPEFFHRIIDELERCLTKRERITIPGASHTVPGENPQAYDEAVLAFLANH